jgi:hypothetical protein
VVFPAPLMSTIAELGTFLARETEAASGQIHHATPSQSGAVLKGSSLLGPRRRVRFAFTFQRLGRNR